MAMAALRPAIWLLFAMLSGRAFLALIYFFGIQKELCTKCKKGEQKKKKQKYIYFLYASNLLNFSITCLCAKVAQRDIGKLCKFNRTWENMTEM